MSFSNDRVSVMTLSGYNSREDNTNETLNNERGVRYRDAVCIDLPGGEVWLFDYGVAVFWAVNEDERSALLNRLNIVFDAVKNVNHEHFRFTFDEKELRISRDTINLTDNTPLTRLAVSHALAQSIKLNEYETQAQQTIIDHSELPKDLAETGKIAISRKEIAQIRGRLFSTKSDIILHYGLLDTPEFFWEYPEYEATYNAVTRYLEIRQRVDLLSTKLATIHELFEMLADEQKHQHSSFLEWIIIVLIAIEIFMFIAQEVQNIVG